MTPSSYIWLASKAESSKYITRKAEPELYEDLVWFRPKRGTITPLYCSVLLCGLKIFSMILLTMEL